MKIQEEWVEVCETFAKRIEAELLFVKSDSFGICTKGGKLMHIYADELANILKGRNWEGLWQYL